MNSMVERIIKKLQGHSAPRYHGNGFIQWYLNDHQRLHIWTEGLPNPPPNNARIHDHMFDMSSDILLGKLEHEVYEFLPHEWGNYKAFRINPGKKTAFDTTFLDYGYLEIYHTFELPTGSHYMQRHGTFHKTASITALTITIMTKMGDFGSPRIICPRELKPTNAFAPHNLSTFRITAEVRAALTKLPEDQLIKVYKCVDPSFMG